MTQIKYEFKKTDAGEEQQPVSMEVIPTVIVGQQKLHESLGLEVKRMIELQDLVIQAPDFKTIAAVMQHCSKQCKTPNELAFVIYVIAVENTMANVNQGTEFRTPFIVTPKDQIS